MFDAGNHFERTAEHFRAIAQSGKHVIIGGLPVFLRYEWRNWHWLRIAGKQTRKSARHRH
jgi:hypothetical protein